MSQKTTALLNEMLAKDSEAMNCLLSSWAPCNKELGEGGYYVQELDGKYRIHLLGLINTILEVNGLDPVNFELSESDGSIRREYLRAVQYD